MPFITVRKLARETSDVLDMLKRDREPLIVTRDGEPVAALVAVDEAAVRDHVLATAPEYVDRRRHADETIAAGRAHKLADLVEAEDAHDTAELEAPAYVREHLLLVAESVLALQPGGVAAGAPGALAAVASAWVARHAQRVAAEIGDGAEAESGRATDRDIGRLQGLGVGLLARVWAENLLDASSERLAAIGEQVATVGVSGQVLHAEALSASEAERTLTVACETVDAVSAQIVGAHREAGVLSIDAYEATVRGIDAFERFGHRAQHVHVAPRAAGKWFARQASPGRARPDVPAAQ